MALFDCECLCVICSGIGIGVYSTKKEGECSKMCSQVDTGGFHPWTYPCLRVAGTCNNCLQSVLFVTFALHASSDRDCVSMCVRQEFKFTSC